MNPSIQEVVAKVSKNLSDEKLRRALVADTGNPESDAFLHKVAETCLKLPEDRRRPVMQEAMRQALTEAKKRDEAIIDAKGRIEALDFHMTWGPYNGIRATIESNDCSRLHKFFEACNARRIIDRSDGMASSKTELFAEVVKQTFVVKHDWAKAFESASGMDGEVKFPYDFCAFEFRISGRSVVAVCVGEQEGWDTTFCAFAECGDYWYGFENNDDERDIIEYIWGQIRAICISLDAEIATHEVVRAPEKLNRKRIDSGKLPLLDFHVVDLAKRHRVANPACVGGSHKSPRLHFVRGHWRHLEHAKVWIKWHLRGNPELGYIQKEYAL